MVRSGADDGGVVVDEVVVVVVDGVVADGVVVGGMADGMADGMGDGMEVGDSEEGVEVESEAVGSGSGATKSLVCGAKGGSSVTLV